MGIVPLLTLIVSVVVKAHCPGSGVNVYVVVAVLLSAGAQEPVMPSLETVGSGERLSPEQIGGTGAKVGVG